MSSKDELNIREEYLIVNCCNPRPGDPIVGYHSHGEHIKIHKAGCPNLKNVDPQRLIELSWEDVLVKNEFTPDDLYDSLEKNDFRILKLHHDFGLDYSLKVARMLHLDKQEVFDRHKRLLQQGLLRRVPKLMIRYRKGVVDNKWIKHRNHTYYELTELGTEYVEYYESQSVD